MNRVLKLVARWVGAFLLLFCSSFYSSANETTPNVITTTTQQGVAGVEQSWSGFTVTTSTGGGLGPLGSQPGYNNTTGQFMFGYMQGTIGYTMAINSALSGTGIQITGIEYGLNYLNQGEARGTLSVTAGIYSSAGINLRSYTHNLPQTTNGWTQWGQTQTFTNPYELSSLGNASLTMTGKDDRFWGGYYGPQFKDPYLRFNYTADVCASNPLSSPDCAEYAAAYLSQQCTVNSLYNSQCPGYAAAYFTQQCTINALHNQACPGYAAAYLTYQCSVNPLYATQCPGYETAYFTQQCNLDGLYSRDCPNYSIAYAKKNVLNIGTTTTSTSNTTSPIQVAQVSKTEATATVSSDGSVKTEVSKTGDSNVDKAISAPTTTTNTAAAPAAAVQLAPKQENKTEPSKMVAAAPAKEEKKEQKQEPKSEGGGSQQQNAKADGGDKDKPKTAREEIQQKREEAAKAKAVEEGKQLAGKMGESASFEQQIAVQNVVIQAMGFTPGFDSYNNYKIFDAPFYKSTTIYGNNRNVDNARLGRGLTGASDRIHEQMVMQQYNK